ncbi:Rossmann-like and DUF2520 domain-containing protein [Flavobacterium luteum]|uniref:DUF2520 domain-containing protein n=1 Tax=Flavobacterium luteum TaxID=2026654 RepID=A0A7J5AKK4_9FLAO|nr:Rossmann-like and DUF2520 domain-containing protein [Flavobacterium luteum]KAB1158137.1 DUF2520 domain-containing protein [Flavobacterium luteum]
MYKAVIIGSGNVAQHLLKAFQKSDIIDVIQVFARNKGSITHLIDAEKIVSNFDELLEASVYFICVSDHAVVEVSSKIPFSNKLVLHTAGNIAIESLDPKNIRGAFYPVQTFSKSRDLDFSKIPVCIEVELESRYKVLEIIAFSVTPLVYRVTSEQRKAIHIAAVFVNNFVNHLYEIGKEISDNNLFLFQILQPLIQETAAKIITLNPDEAQTGPAKRGDMQTIDSHLDFLTNENHKEIYQLLTQSIINHGKKL